MKTMYIECNMGAAGDMLTAALLELCQEPEKTVEKLNSIGIPGVEYTLEKSVKCGITGSHITVSVNGEVENEHCHNHEHHHDHGHEHEHHHHDHSHHNHAGMDDIEHIINNLTVSDKVKNDAMAVYGLIAEAESHAHGRPVTEIHFHEVGTMDAIADVVGVCMLMEELAPDKVIASPVNVGSGTVHCAHGILPVPAPATAHILRDIPIYSGKIKSELCTPTGAALLKYFASDFRELPVMRVSKIGYGMGTKDFDEANCVRTLMGETEDKTDRIAELRCNLDDMTGEETGFAVSRLFAAGALDVFTVPIGMKKNRPGILLTCMCREEDKEKLTKLIFKYTTTLGVREYLCNRYVLERNVKKVNTNYGEVTVKESKGWGVTRVKPEYDELEKIAVENNISISDIKPEI